MKKFTLVEILIGIAVIAILVGMSVGVTSFVKDKIARSSTQSTMKLIEMAFAKYKSDFGMYPALDVSVPPAPCYLSLDDLNLTTLAGEQLKNKIWGYFNDVTAEADHTGKSKIRGVSLVYESGKYYIVDGWKNKIIYVCPGVFNTESFDLISIGGDSKFDGTASNPRLPTRAELRNFDISTMADDVTNFSRN